MNDFFTQSVFFGAALTLAVYELACLLCRKIRHPLMNPLLLSMAVIIGVLLLLRVDYTTYYAGAGYITYFLTPATVCLAVPLYRQIESLKKNWRAILAGIISGVVVSGICIWLLALCFGLSHPQYVTMLPKSVTAAIGMPLSAELGGNPAITMTMIALTGIFGNIFAAKICRLFHLTDPVARGIAIGNAAHAFGTVRALEMGEVEGAMSGLSLAVSGVLTVIAASVFASFL